MDNNNLQINDEYSKNLIQKLNDRKFFLIKNLFKNVFNWKYIQYEALISCSFLSKLKYSDLDILLICLLDSNWREKEKALHSLIKKLHQIINSNQLTYLIRQFIQKCFKRGEIEIVRILKMSKLIEFYYPEAIDAVQLLSKVRKFPHPIHDFLIEMFNVWEYDKPLDRNMSTIMSPSFPWKRLHILENAFNLTYDLGWAVDNAISMLDTKLLEYLINQHSREKVESCINNLDIIKICSRNGVVNEATDDFASFCVSSMAVKFSTPLLNIEYSDLNNSQIIPVVILKIAYEIGLNDKLTNLLIENSCLKLKRWDIYQNTPGVLDDAAKCLAIALTYGEINGIDIFYSSDMNFCLDIFANSDDLCFGRHPIDESIISYTSKCLAVAFGYGFQFCPAAIDRFIELYSYDDKLIKIVQASIQPSSIRQYFCNKQYKVKLNVC